MAAFLFAEFAISAQDVFLDRWQQLSAAQPQAVTFTITAPKTEFYLGEAIPLQLQFTSSQPRAFLAETKLQDRVGRLNYPEEFIVDPQSLTKDPLSGLPAGQGGLGGPIGSPALLSDKPFAFERLLNEWVRFLRPGVFRVYVISRRVGPVSNPAELDGPPRIPMPTNPFEAVSNILTLQIRPAPAAWVQQQIAAAKAVLDRPWAPGTAEAKEWRKTVITLSSLDSPEAAEELVRHLPDNPDADSVAAYFGVFASPYRQRLLPLMEQRLTAADYPVSDRYLRSLPELAELVAEGGPMPPYPKDPAAQKAWQDQSQRRMEIRKQKQDEYAARLIASLPAKQPQARAVSLNTLLNVGSASATEPPWLRNVAASLIADFRSLPEATQSMLLESRWSILRGPAMLPLLRDLAANPATSLRDSALRRLYELSPEEGRKIILDEIRQPTGNIPFSTLAMLPDKSLPELNGVLADRMDDLLILRYATGDIVKRLESAYLAKMEDLRKENSPFCIGQLVFYFLKYDPPFGERILREEFARPSSAPVCYDIGSQFHQLGRWAYSPALERIAIESLTSNKMPVKRGAAELLGKYGSTAAQKPLWETMEYFRSWWKGRETELTQRQGEESMRFEGTLRHALARTDAWVPTEAELARLLNLCSSDGCRAEVGQWIRDAKSPVTINIVSGPDGDLYMVAQYGPGGADWLRRKLQQFPEGAAFRVQGTSAARERAESIVRAAGRTLSQ